MTSTIRPSKDAKHTAYSPLSRISRATPSSHRRLGGPGLPRTGCSVAAVKLRYTTDRIASRDENSTLPAKDPGRYTGRTSVRLWGIFPTRPETASPCRGGETRIVVGFLLKTKFDGKVVCNVLDYLYLSRAHMADTAYSFAIFETVLDAAKCRWSNVVCASGGNAS